MSQDYHDQVVRRTCRIGGSCSRPSRSQGARKPERNLTPNIKLVIGDFARQRVQRVEELRRLHARELRRQERSLKHARAKP